MYRPKIDTTLAPIQYNEMPSVDPPKPQVQKPAASVESTAPKPKAVTPAQNSGANNSGGTVAKQTATTPAKPQEKPKPKKVVIE